MNQPPLSRIPAFLLAPVAALSLGAMDPAPAAPDPAPAVLAASPTAAAEAVASFEAMAPRFRTLANLAYWDRERRLDEHLEGHAVPPAVREDLLCTLETSDALKFSRNDRDLAYLLKQAFEARRAQAADAEPRPPEALLRAGFIGWTAQLPSDTEMATMIAPFYALMDSMYEEADATWEQDHPESGPYLNRLGFLLRWLKGATAERFAGHPACAAFFRHLFTGDLKRLSKDHTPEEVREDRRAMAGHRRVFEQGLAELHQLRSILRQVREDQAQMMAVRDEAKALEAGARRRLRKVGAEIAGYRRVQEQAELEAAELASLKSAETAPISPEERARLEELSLAERKAAEDRRNLARELGKAPRRSPASRPAAPSEEKKAPAVLPVRWHPEARREFRDAVDPKTREHIDEFINKTLRAKGLELGMPHCKHLMGATDLWELRPQGHLGAWRPVYGRVGGELVILAFGPDGEDKPGGLRAAIGRAHARRARMLGGA